MHFKPFYGWWVVSASFLVTLYVGAVVFYGFTAIFEPIASEFGWSYTAISFAFSLRGFEEGLLNVPVGVLTDRWGPRRIIFAGVATIAVGMFLFSQINSLIMFYVSYAIIALGMSGCSQTVNMTAVANWFRKKVGIASGIALAGFGLSGLLVPVIVKLIDINGWRSAMVILAIGLLVLILPLSLIFRHKPEQYGYLPDGTRVKDTIKADGVAGLAVTPKRKVETKQVLKSRTFWCVLIVSIILSMLLNTVSTHVMPYLSSVGIDRSQSSFVAGIIPVVSIVGRIGFGWLGDKINKRLITAWTFVMVSAGLLCFGFVSVGSMWLVVPFLVLFGIGSGGINSMRPLLVREYFGRSSFGTIFGLMLFISYVGAAAGPPIAGWVYDDWHSYQSIWIIFAVVTLAGIIAVLSIPKVKGTVELAAKS